jgi:dTDP-glucose pyrophosphorylase
MLNIVIPMAGGGRSFKEAGYAFPKPLIDISGKTMISLVVENLRPSTPHKFIFVCLKEHYDTYDLHNILKNATNNNFEVVLLHKPTQGAASTVLCAVNYINTEDELLIANADQYLDIKIDDFISEARNGDKDGLILTFKASHPKWSYARVDSQGKVLETAEKKVISDHATVGIYYFKQGSDFVRGAQNMIHKGIHHNNEFYVCPVFNELILNGKNVHIMEIEATKVHGLGTPEDVDNFMGKINAGMVTP